MITSFLVEFAAAATRYCGLAAAAAELRLTQCWFFHKQHVIAVLDTFLGGTLRSIGA